MRIILKFDDKITDFKTRFRPGTEDVCITIRPNPKTAKLEIEWVYPNYPIEKIIALMNAESKINVEIIAHSSRAGKTLQSETTKKHPKITIGIDTVTQWLENFITPENLPKSTISLLTCEAAAQTTGFTSIAEQMLRLFETKPLKITARVGFVYIEKELHSLGVLMTAAERLDNQLNLGIIDKRNKSTPTGEKFAFYYDPTSHSYYKADKYLFDFFRLLKNDNSAQEIIKNITSKKFETISTEEFSNLIDYALKHYQDQTESDIFKKAKIIKSGGIYGPVQLTGHIDSFKQKEKVELGIKYYLGLLVANDNDIQNVKEIHKTLEIILAFVQYRQLRNYEISDFQNVCDMLGHVIAHQNGIFSSADIKMLSALHNNYQSTFSILTDTMQRSLASNIHGPSFYREVYAVTHDKNTNFSNVLSQILSIIDPEKNLKKGWAQIEFKGPPAIIETKQEEEQEADWITIESTSLEQDFDWIEIKSAPLNIVLPKEQHQENNEKPPTSSNPKIKK